MRRRGAYGLEAACVAAATCFTIRMLGLRYGLAAPMPPARGEHLGRGMGTGRDDLL